MVQPRPGPYGDLQGLYREARACARFLGEGGFGEGAKGLDDSLHGSTSGEILTDIAACIAALLASRPDLPAGALDRLARLLHEADRLLREAGQITP